MAATVHTAIEPRNTAKHVNAIFLPFVSFIPLFLSRSSSLPATLPFLPAFPSCQIPLFSSADILPLPDRLQPRLHAHFPSCRTGQHSPGSLCRQRHKVSFRPYLPLQRRGHNPLFQRIPEYPEHLQGHRQGQHAGRAGLPGPVHPDFRKIQGQRPQGHVL